MCKCNCVKPVLLVAILFCGLTTVLKAGYYKSDFFPIGLTGINYTGDWSCPYYGKGWRWDDPDTTNEKALIEALGVNCIGSEDAYRRYLLDFNPSSGHSQDNYLYKVCKPLTDADPDNPVLLITASYYTTPRVHLCPIDTIKNDTTLYLRCCNCEQGEDPDSCCKDKIGIGPDSSVTEFLLDITDVDKCEYAYYVDSVSGDTLPVLLSFSTTNWPANSMFRSPYRNYKKDELEQYVGSMQFSLRIYPDNYGCGEYNRHGVNPYDGDNWNIFGGDRVWCEVADEAVANFDTFFFPDRHGDLAQYIWGWNLITEDPAVSRSWKNENIYWRGCWAGVDRIFRGSNSTGFSLSDTAYHKWFSPTHTGIRGVEATTLGGTNRMIIAKQGTAILHRGGYNIFEALPDLDAFITYSHQWARPYWNYGQQEMFDCFLYGEPTDPPQAKGGRQNIAIYFQQNTKPSGQRGRWLETIDLAWYTTGASWGASRRPCPPEIRCATYLSLSRGAKGIFFHGWTFTSNPGEYPNATIPCSSVDLDAHVGIRDHNGYPFGEAGSYNLKLNSSAPQAPYWSGRTDSTYYYLKTHLIPEIKAISGVLMQLEWVNAYSLNSTAPEWRSPCPHYYVEDVWGVEYADLGFFDHPYEPVGVEYFMLVNREGITDMTNRTVSVALDAGHWPEEDTLILTDIAKADYPRKLIRDGERFTFTEVFEPGEGKLYRVAPTNEASITLVPSTEGGVR